MKLLLACLIFGATLIGVPSKTLQPKTALDGQERIIGGSEAQPGEIPYIVTLQTYDFIGGRYLTCAGSILDPNYVVTAAHCVFMMNTRNLEVVAGTHSIHTEEPTEQRRDIAFVTIHPKYNQFTLDADIAVITLSKPFILNDYVKPIQLAPKYSEPSGECINSGFGNTLNNGSISFANILQKVELSILPRSTCRELYTGMGAVTLGMICASVPEGGKGACHGDSGGPLTCKLESGEEYLAGTVSWGMRICALPNEPSVYGNIAYYRDFIDEAISD